MQKGGLENEKYRSSTSWALVTLMFILSQSILLSQNYYEEFTNYTIDDGFQSMINYDVVQDQKGYIWMATDAGLSRFNGKDFKNYGLKEGLDQNDIVRMGIDSVGRIWLNSSGKISYVQNDSIFQLDILDSRDLHWNFKVQSESSNTWIATKGEILYLDQNLQKLNIDIKGKDQRKSGYLIVGSKKDTTILLNQGYLEFRVEGKVERKLELNGAYAFDNLQNHQFYIEENNLYYCGKNGLEKLDLDSGKSIIISSKYTSSRKIEKVGDNIWLSYLKEGMVCLNLEEDKIVATENYLEDKLCSNFIFDNDKNLWVATYGDGLFFFPKQFKGIENYSKDVIFEDLQTILVDEKNTWIGKLDGELLRIKDSEYKYYSYKQFRRTPINRILQIIKLDDESLVLASDDGLLLFENEQISVKHGMATKSVFLHGDSLIVNNYSYTYKISVDDFIEIDTPLSTSQMENSTAIKKILNGRAYSSIVDSKKVCGLQILI